jgi:hypothetical protein
VKIVARHVLGKQKPIELSEDFNIEFGDDVSDAIIVCWRGDVLDVRSPLRCISVEPQAANTIWVRTCAVSFLAGVLMVGAGGLILAPDYGPKHCAADRAGEWYDRATPGDFAHALESVEMTMQFCGVTEGEAFDAYTAAADRALARMMGRGS